MTENSVKKHGILKYIIITLVLIFIINCIMFNYVKNVSQSLEENVLEDIHDLSIQSSIIIKERISNDVAELKTIGYYVGDVVSGGKKRLIEELRKIEEKSIYKTLNFVDVKGNVYNSTGKKIEDGLDNEYIQDALLGNAGVSEVIDINGKCNVVLIYAPVYQDEAIIGAMIGEYNINELVTIYGDKEIQKKSDNYLINSKGNIFSDCDEDLNLEVDIFSWIKQKYPDIYNEFKSNVENQKSGVFSIYNKQEYIIGYAPIGEKDWYFLEVLPKKVVTTQALDFIQQGTLAITFVLIVLIIGACLAGAELFQVYVELKKAHLNIKHFYNSLPGSAFTCRFNDDLTLIEASDNFYKMTGYSKENFTNKFTDIITKDYFNEVLLSIKQQIKDSNTFNVEVKITDVNKNAFWVHLNGELVEDTIYCLMIENSDYKQAQEQVYMNNQRYEFIMNQTKDIIFDYNVDDEMMFVTKNFEVKFKYTFEKDILIKKGDVYKYINTEDYPKIKSLLSEIKNGSKNDIVEIRILNSIGNDVWCKINATGIYDEENKLVRVVGVIVDIEKEKQELLKLSEMAKRDSLTYLYNKKNTESLIDDYINSRTGDGALLIIDIDDFKCFNNKYGHLFGDHVISTVAQNLKSKFRNDDIIGRIGGDEFIVFIKNINKTSEINGKVKSVLDAFNHKVIIDDIEVNITCSIGVSRYPLDGDSFKELYINADKALYQAKDQGKNTFVYYK